MALFKCKMCGGDLEVTASVGTCQYCGTQQTLPQLDDRRENLYNRASHFRRQNDFDKAAALYEAILNEDRTDAEAYWSLVLCKYGIEYVEDPVTHKCVPTCNRTQYTSVVADADYKQALVYAEGGQRVLYEAEAKAIDVLQKGILKVSAQEKPFDIFICYKEADRSGRRTPDSVLAQDMYHQLTHEGFNVFFSRITLEAQIGTAYEPYIFAALQSARIMVVLGTKAEYFNAVWVRNEWSRYLDLIKEGRPKVLIPAYRDMDPYDLPQDFSHLQAQDMGKLGFMQDLMRGIKKILESEGEKAAPELQVMAVPGMSGTGPVLQRAFIELEGGGWQKADQLLERVLNSEPRNAMAYVGKLCLDMRVTREAELVSCAEPLDQNMNYRNALRFADEGFRARLEGYDQAVKERLYQEAELRDQEEAQRQRKREAETARRLEVQRHCDYEAAVRRGKAAQSAAELQDAADAFRELRLKGYQDAEAQAAKYDQLAAEEKQREATGVAGVVFFFLFILIIIVQILYHS